MRSAMPACFGAVAGKVWPAVRAVVQAAVATSQFCEACLRAATRALRWSRARVRPHKLSGRCLACFRVRHMWVSARSDAACVCMCARGSGCRQKLRDYAQKLRDYSQKLRYYAQKKTAGKRW